MSGPVFVDTNVFVYRHDLSDPVKQELAEQWIELLASTRTGRLSYQVLQELFATLTRTRGPVFPRSEAREIVEALAVWRPIQTDIAILQRAWVIQECFRISWWDSLIAAAAQASACRILLTEDLQDGQVPDTVRVLNPFAPPGRRPRETLAAVP